ncbi:hypothetical protein VTN96DRAFT_89 [Rasamsonia emersonii]
MAGTVASSTLTSRCSNRNRDSRCMSAIAVSQRCSDPGFTRHAACTPHLHRDPRRRVRLLQVATEARQPACSGCLTAATTRSKVAGRLQSTSPVSFHRFICHFAALIATVHRRAAPLFMARIAIHGLAGSNEESARPSWLIAPGERMNTGGRATENGS